MESLKDKNGVTIEKMDTVNVPEPDSTDIHIHEFTGMVVGERNGNIIVEDGDGDCFEIEPERLDVIN